MYVNNEAPRWTRMANRGVGIQRQERLAFELPIQETVRNFTVKSEVGDIPGKKNNVRKCTEVGSMGHI